jgi:hypothetical protein
VVRETISIPCRYVDNVFVRPITGQQHPYSWYYLCILTQMNSLPSSNNKIPCDRNQYKKNRKKQTMKLINYSFFSPRMKKLEWSPSKS